MKKIIIHTERAPLAIGAYSQAVRSGNTVYISGQLGLDPGSMTMVEGGFTEQAKQIFANLDAIAKEAGGSLADALKLTVYVTDLNDFGGLNELMELLMPKPYPARAVVQVSALPKGGLVEVDAVLCLD